MVNVRIIEIGNYPFLAQGKEKFPRNSIEIEIYNLLIEAQLLYTMKKYK